MKKLSSFLGLTFLLFQSMSSQSLLFSENFEGAGSSFTLNTTDMGGVTNGNNFWVINNKYASGNIDIQCTNSGSPLGISYTPAVTANQPLGVTNFPNSRYLHVLSRDGQNMAIPVLNSNFIASDGGSQCWDDAKNVARMSGDISTIGFTNINFNFYWLCEGDLGYSEGRVYYSTDMGISWTQNLSPLAAYAGRSTWAQQTLTNAAWANQATIRFAFMFSTVTDNGYSIPPGFSLDEVTILGTPSSGSTITTSALSASTYCAGATISVPFVTTGSFTNGNVFSAQLSDDAGNFGVPNIIGTFPGTSSGSINATIPSNTPPGTGYRIRVISSTPHIIGTVTTSNFAITAGSIGGMLSSTRDSVCEGDTVTLSLTGNSTGTIAWQGSSDGITFNSITGSTTTNVVTPAFAVSHYRVSVTTGLCPAAYSDTLNVVRNPAPFAGFTYVFTPPFTVAFTNTTPGTNTYLWKFGDSQTSSTPGPTHVYASAASYTVTLIATSSLGCIDSLIDTVVITGVGNESLNLSKLSVYPNPAMEFVACTLPPGCSNQGSLKVVDLAGKLISSKEINATPGAEIRILLNGFSKGLYRLVLESNGLMYSGSFVVE